MTGHVRSFSRLLPRPGNATKSKAKSCVISNSFGFAPRKKACHRIANSINRAPAGVHRRLEEALTALVKESVLDLEVLDAICSATLEAFKTSRDPKLERLVLRTLAKI